MNLALRPTQQRQAHPGSVYIYVALLESFKSQQRAAASLHSLPKIRHLKPLPHLPRRLAGISLHLFLYTIYISTAASLSGFLVAADKSGKKTLR